MKSTRDEVRIYDQMNFGRQGEEFTLQLRINRHINVESRQDSTFKVEERVRCDRYEQNLKDGFACVKMTRPVLMPVGLSCAVPQSTQQSGRNNPSGRAESSSLHGRYFNSIVCIATESLKVYMTKFILILAPPQSSTPLVFYI
jgi:hypothetical protein